MRYHYNCTGYDTVFSKTEPISHAIKYIPGTCYSTRLWLNTGLPFLFTKVKGVYAETTLRRQKHQNLSIAPPCLVNKSARASYSGRLQKENSIDNTSGPAPYFNGSRGRSKARTPQMAPKRVFFLRDTSDTRLANIPHTSCQRLGA